MRAAVHCVARRHCSKFSVFKGRKCLADCADDRSPPAEAGRVGKRGYGECERTRGTGEAEGKIEGRGTRVGRGPCLHGVWYGTAELAWRTAGARPALIRLEKPRAVRAVAR